VAAAVFLVLNGGGVGKLYRKAVRAEEEHADKENTGNMLATSSSLHITV
jgi:hypothetical protein